MNARRNHSFCYAFSLLFLGADTFTSGGARIPWTRRKCNSRQLFAAPNGSANAAFGSTVFTNKFIPSKLPGVDIPLPDFDELFGRIAQVSPLAKHAMENNLGGLDTIQKDEEAFNWKETENHPKRTVRHIDKIAHFQGHDAPLIRFRSTLRGPSKKRGEIFSDLLTTFEQRRKWDPNLAEIDELYPAADLNDANLVMGNKYGKTVKFGVGYCKTKRGVVSPREQLTLCGLQEFPSGASLIWGVEMEDNMNHLLPGMDRHGRSRSHIFSTVLIPTGENTFDAEYVLQLEIGKFPEWLASPVITEIVKGLFRYADKYYQSGLSGGELAKYLETLDEEEEEEIILKENPVLEEERFPLMSEEHVLEERQSLLMTP